MQLVEQHVIKQGDSRYAVIDSAAFAAKNLYNAALYLVRQTFIFEHRYLNYAQVYHRIKSQEAYCALPRKVSNDVLRLLDKNWKSYFATVKAYHADPGKFLGHPKLPGYKDKVQGRTILIYDIQAVSKTALRKGVIAPSQLGITIPTKKQNVKQVRIVPKSRYYVVEVVYEQEPEQATVDSSLIASIDIGLNNLATLTSNKASFAPRIVNGRPIKSVNQFYNKRKATLQSKVTPDDYTHRMERITIKRTRRIDHYLHTASRRIVDLLISERIGTLIIGHNPNWKQEANMGKRNNQNFVQVPHARFISMLTYKCQLVGIVVIVTEESYTSKASFLDSDALPVYGKCTELPVFSGKRIKRGLYRAASGQCFNADVNGAYNILRKVAPDAFEQGSRGCAVHPLSLAV